MSYCDKATELYRTWMRVWGCLVFYSGIAALLWRPAAAQQVAFDFDSQVSAADRLVIQSAVPFANGYFRGQFGAAVAHVTVNVFSTDDPDGKGSTANAGSETILVFTRSRGWSEASDEGRFKIMVHEMFHVLQYQLAEGGLGAERWLAEGSAEYVGYRGADAAGVLRFGLARAQQVEEARAQTKPLQTMVLADPGFYSVAFVAAEVLANRSGFPALAEYFRRGPTAQTFETVFGQPPSSFAQQFDAQRQELPRSE